MPTGYTACIEDGVSFEKFVMGCARAFGACVTMRDDPTDTPIPEEFKSSGYHKAEITKHLKEIERVKKLSIQACEAEALKEYKREVAECKHRIHKYQQLQEKYEAMLEQVRAWKCPTSHQEFKNFMIEQITGSIEFDCNTQYTTEELNKLVKDGPLSGALWKLDRIKELNKDLEYDTKEDRAEEERVAGRNKWIKDLRESLKGGSHDVKR